MRRTPSYQPTTSTRTPSTKRRRTDSEDTTSTVSSPAINSMSEQQPEVDTAPESVTNLENTSETPEQQATTANFQQQTPTKIKPENEAVFKAYRMLRCKILQSKHHIEVLQIHTNNGSVPNGLYSTLEPNVPEVDIDLIVEWEETKFHYHQRLIQCLSQFWIRHLSRLIQDSSTLENTLRRKTTDQEWTRIQELITRAENNLMSKLQNNKQRARNTQPNRRRNIEGSGPKQNMKEGRSSRRQDNQQ